MIRVANLAQFELTSANIQRSQADLARNQIQIASGKKAQAYSEISTQSAQLVSLERTLDRNNQFMSNIDQAATRLNTMESSLSVMVERATEVKGIISNAMSGSNINDLPLQEFARTFATEIASLRRDGIVQ